ncbi:MAG: YfhO family protein, partial [bacterium]|nr:YfhO family protein [bacterium]
SDVHAGFGGSVLPLFGLVVLAFGLPFRRPPWIIGALLILTGLVLAHSLGAATPLHRLVWETVPLQQSMRIPGRATMLLPVLLMWILTWVFKEYGGVAPTSARQGTTVWLTVAVMATLLIVVLGTPQIWDRPAAPFAPARLRDIPLWSYQLWFGAGLTCVIAFVLARVAKERRILFEVVFCVSLVVQVCIAIGYGTWAVNKPRMPTLAELQAYKQKTLDYPSSFGSHMYPGSVIRHLEHTFIQPQLARLYSAYQVATTQEEAYRLLATRRQPDVVVLEGNIEATGDTDGADPPDGSTASVRDQVNLQYASFNRLLFGVHTAGSSYLVLPYPYTERWHARIDGTPTTIYRANGNENAVRVPAGTHQVELRYRSPVTLLGAVLTGVTLVVLVLCFTLVAHGISRRVLVLTLAMVGTASIFGFWYTHLYTGRNLGTIHTWIRPVKADRANLAYGRRTVASSTPNKENFHQYHSSRAVDGNRTSWFATGRQVDPWWEVDLGSPHTLERIVLWSVSRVALPPRLRFELLDHRGQLQFVTEVHSVPAAPAWKFDLPEPISARRVRIVAPAGDTPVMLALSEVQLYGRRNAP